MGDHIIDGEFQSDKYPWCGRGFVPLKLTDKMAQDLLWEYAQRRREVDPEFASDLETCLIAKGYAVSQACVTCQQAFEFSEIAYTCALCSRALMCGKCLQAHWDAAHLRPEKGS